MSLQALMALLGHVTPAMTLRYAALADGTVRDAYDAAIAKVRGRRELPLVVAGRPAIPNRVTWLRSEMLKTRVAHGYCSRHLAAEACPYATSASSATTTPPTSSSSRRCRPSSPTSRRCVTTPKPAAGTGRSPATPGSSPACSATSTGSNNPAWRTLRLDPGLRAG